MIKKMKHSLPPGLKKRLQMNLFIACLVWQLLHYPLGQLHYSRTLDFVATIPLTNYIPGNYTLPKKQLVDELSPFREYPNNGSAFAHRWNTTYISQFEEKQDNIISSSLINSELHSMIQDRDNLVDCGCPKTCTAKALNRNELVINQPSSAAPFTCRERIEKHLQYGKTEREACTVAFEEKFTPCDSACDPRKCKAAVVLPSMQKVLDPVLPTYQGNGTKNILIIAAVPRSNRHSVALWSELECIAAFYDEIIISSPEWSRSLMDEIVRQARQRLTMNIEARYYVNDRYDVGLWCDALQEVLDSRGMDPIKTITMLNDSVYAFRKFSGILDALSHRPFDLDMVGVNYYNHSDSQWLESVLRGFPIRSIPIFNERICKVANKKPCSKLGPIKRKRCIVEKFEIEAASNFFPNRTAGLFPSNPPSDWPLAEKIWAEQPKFWKEVLVEKMGFPLAKHVTSEQPEKFAKVPTLPTSSKALRFPIPAPLTPLTPSITHLVSPRGAKLATRVWPSINTVPSALCLLVHGGGWNSGYFEVLATFLTKHNIIVAVYDQPGAEDGAILLTEPDTPSPTVRHMRSFHRFAEDIFEAV